MRILLILLSILSTTIKADEYKIGSGIRVANSPIYIGGYVMLDYINRNDNYNRIRIDDIALISYANYSKFSYLAEFEIKDSYVKEWGKRDSFDSSERISVERLHVDYSYGDNFDFRIGKFNTPVGYWNLTPISVLRDSASSPYLAYILYPRYTTGLQIKYENHLDGGDAYTAIVQNNQDLDDSYNNMHIKTHVAFGVERESDLLFVKANVGYFKAVSGIESYYYLLSLLYEDTDYDISAELGGRKVDSGWSVPYALYLQGVYHLTPQHDIVARVESYEIDEGAFRNEQIGIMGYTYRPVQSMAYKAEYQLRSYTNESQIKLSFSVLF